MYFHGIIIAVITFLCIGLFHPIVIKFEYHFGCKGWPVFLVLGIAFISLSLFFADEIISSTLGVLGCSCLWSIRELFEQRKRVEKGWFPENPKKKTDESIKSIK